MVNGKRIARQKARAKATPKVDAEIIPLKPKPNQLARLATIRTELHLSQQEVAEQLGTTQQAVARWERGTSEPTLAQLRDLALILGTSVSELISQKGTVSVDHHHHWSRDRTVTSGFWGHIGIKLSHAKFSTWYPVTEAEMQRIYSRCHSADEDEPWLLISTLANRELVVNINNVQKVQFLDHGNAEVPGDSEDFRKQEPFELFAALATVSPESDELDDAYEASDNMRATVKQYVAKYNKNAKEGDPDFFSFMHDTIVHLNSGEKFSYWAGDYAELANMSIAGDSGFGPSHEQSMAHFEDQEGDFDAFIPVKLISLIEMPATLVEEGFESLRAADEDDDSD